ncbi:hypothetical protein ACFQBQ_06030 [Granulicella cerasi]|uniref:Uncharacterized protein n=1 Tax=Granulicella cerasi TaxID=741063 RepID=A0ABW1Z704_9BACT|nr:hypothetical protein [Granulicella cerasi]
MKKLVLLSVVLCVFWLRGRAQAPKQAEPKFAQAQVMSSERSDDSYVIYSYLLEQGPIEGRSAPRKQWLLEATTYALPMNFACDEGKKLLGAGPHSAVRPPEDRKAEWDAVMADYDAHCHDVIALDGGKFRDVLPVHLLDEAAKKRYQAQQFRRHAENEVVEFPDAAGLHEFSEVYFNPQHTLALVHQGMWCGGLCGNWEWVALEKKNGKWSTLSWTNMVTFS